MKIRLLNSMSIFMMLFWLTGCGDVNNASLEENRENTGITVTVNNPSIYKLVAQKTNNVDLVIDSMKMDVYKADSPTDSDLTGKTLFSTKAFETPTDGKWSVKLDGMEKSKDYIFVVSAFNATDTTKPIFEGLTTTTIEPTGQTEVKINLDQSSDLYGNSNNAETISTASNISIVKDANGDIKLFFTLHNSNESLLTWSLFNVDGTTPSTEFSSNSGTTSDPLLAVELGYIKAVDSTSSTYVLELKDEAGATRYTLRINLTEEGNDVLLEVNTPPIIKGMNVSFVNDMVILTPELDKESATVSYAWSLTDSDDGTIVSPSSKTTTVSNYDHDYGFAVRLDVTDNGASSYRVYDIPPYNYYEVKLLIDTNNPADINVLGVPKEEVEALLALYKSTQGVDWYDDTNWNTLTSVDSWNGVHVRDGHVVEIRFVSSIGTNNGLRGTIPSELGNLTNLSLLDLSDNKLIGTIPSELGNLTNLKTLWLTQNQLTGTIPSELGNLTSLNHLRLFQNQLTGTIPGELGNLTNIWVLDLGRNQLTGTIPSELGNLTSLVHLMLSENQLTGTIPRELGSLINLNWLDSSHNQLTGAIPRELGNITNLGALILDNNQLTGSIPSELGNITNLDMIYLTGNKLTGTIPNSFISLNKLEFFYIGANNLEGNIDEALSTFLNALKVFLYDDTKLILN